MHDRFAHNVEMHRLGFVIVFKASDLRLVQFDQLGIQLFRKVLNLACLPMEFEAQFCPPLAEATDGVGDVLNR